MSDVPAVNADAADWAYRDVFRQSSCRTTIFHTPLLFRLTFEVFPLESIRDVGVC